MAVRRRAGERLGVERRRCSARPRERTERDRDHPIGVADRGRHDVAFGARDGRGAAPFAGAHVPLVRADLRRRGQTGRVRRRRGVQRSLGGRGLGRVAVAGGARHRVQLEVTVHVRRRIHRGRAVACAMAPAAVRAQRVVVRWRRAVAGAAGGLTGRDGRPRRRPIRSAVVDRRPVAVGRAARRAVPAGRRALRGEARERHRDRPVHVRQIRDRRVARVAGERVADRPVHHVLLVRAHGALGGQRLAVRAERGCGVRRSRCRDSRCSRRPSHLHRAVDVACRRRRRSPRKRAPSPCGSGCSRSFGGCGSGGGDPWQEPHAVGPADTAVHVGVGVRAARAERRAVAIRGRARRAVPGRESSPATRAP